MTAALAPYRVHHSSPEGILVQMDGQQGFGRLPREALGSDRLADRLLKYLSTQEQLTAALRRGRDAQGYRLLTVLLHELWSPIHQYPFPVQRLAGRLFRKHMMVGLGTTSVAQVVKASERGTVLRLLPHWTALALLEQPDDADAELDQSSAEVRVLNYDVDNNVVHVTTRQAAVQRAPADSVISGAVLAALPQGATVRARVLLSTTDDGCAVVEVPVTVEARPGEPVQYSVLGYYIYDWSGDAAPAGPPLVGATLALTVELAPERDPMLQDTMPFLILSRRKRVAGVPPLRAVLRGLVERQQLRERFAARANPLASQEGLVGYLPWREATGKRARQLAGLLSDEDEDDARGGHEAHKQHLSKRTFEEMLDAYERSMDTALPTSPEEFQRLLLATPNSSYLWTQYMSHHVALHQYEEARQVAEKALQTIGVRESDEALNVWVAYLNVENLYGTGESLTSIFKRAQQRVQDPLALHERLADIFSASGKSNQLLELCRTMSHQFRQERRVWQRLGVVLVQQDKRDQLKHMIRDMSGILDKNSAAVVVVHIAIYEYKHGNVESGRAPFEGLLCKTPKKADVWSAYLDQEMGLLSRQAEQRSIQQTRAIFERAVATGFSAKVMQQLLTKFLAFEKAYGAPKDIEKVKEKARAYVEAKIHAATDTGVV
ncbi:rRNA biogenesis protein RRP5 [Strigomonas culicis]|uniref:rRNA biogenesis protein RRP5 n=1 Tax=Strigomonas culicis TaxID=28005 RepID=S9VNK2_9TRYP|nr:rRNA biogenesis protein RRP5 [Strigomonas culicis]|eukprot:EPY24860.1 rRNA biogenesis protein RRP5 [Strigomonas culicis]